MAKKKSVIEIPQKILDRRPLVKDAISELVKQFGEGVSMSLNSDACIEHDGVSTGCISLDMALGGCGLGKGRITEIFGPESSGKTTLALHVCAEAQKAGGVAAIIDAEHALDRDWAQRLGVDPEALLVSQPGCGEEALAIAEKYVQAGIDVIVVDSVAALIPKQELAGEVGQAQIGLQARLMSQAMRRMTGMVKSSQCVLIFINQIRQKVGVIYGSPETTPGGLALKFAASYRLDIRRISTLKDGEEPIGQRVRCKVTKNKTAPPFKCAEFDIMYNCGISREADIIDIGIESKVLQRSGAWISFNGEHIGQGKDKARQYLVDNPAITEAIAAAVKNSEVELEVDTECERIEPVVERYKKASPEVNH